MLTKKMAKQAAANGLKSTGPSNSTLSLGGKPTSAVKKPMAAAPAKPAQAAVAKHAAER